MGINLLEIISYFKFICLVKGTNMNGSNYEGVAEFVYLGTLISNDNSEEKNTKIYFGRQ